MLKNIPSILSPELLKILMEMGHGDEIVLGDANFPAASTAGVWCAPTDTAVPKYSKPSCGFFRWTPSSPGLRP